MRRSKKKSVLRSSFEDKIVSELRDAQLKFSYESIKLRYVRQCSYTPDLVLPNGVIIELKGRFTSSDRSKHLLVKAQNPELDIRFVFMDASKTLRKGSTTTYGMWCTKNNYIWAEKSVPKEWWK